jgi:hypothetical protein
MDSTHRFEINELKCSETGPNYSAQVHLDGKDGDHDVQLWFAPRPGVSHDELHRLIEHMHKLLSSCQVQISVSAYPITRSERG